MGRRSGPGAAVLEPSPTPGRAACERGSPGTAAEPEPLPSTECPALPASAAICSERANGIER